VNRRPAFRAYAGHIAGEIVATFAAESRRGAAKQAFDMGRNMQGRQERKNDKRHPKRQHEVDSPPEFGMNPTLVFTDKEPSK